MVKLDICDVSSNRYIIYTNGDKIFNKFAMKYFHKGFHAIYQWTIYRSHCLLKKTVLQYNDRAFNLCLSRSDFLMYKERNEHYLAGFQVIRDYCFGFHCIYKRLRLQHSSTWHLPYDLWTLFLSAVSNFFQSDPPSKTYYSNPINIYIIFK